MKILLVKSGANNTYFGAISYFFTRKFLDQARVKCKSLRKKYVGEVFMTTVNTIKLDNKYLIVKLKKKKQPRVHTF